MITPRDFARISLGARVFTRGLALSLALIPLAAQNRGLITHQRVSPSTAYHRVWAVTPLVGTGTPGDPLRPMFIPAPPQPGRAVAPATAVAGVTRPGALGYSMVLSDDHTLALVEYVFESPVAFRAVLAQEAANQGIAVNQNASLTALAPGLAPPTPEQAALEAAIPGLQIFERGKATESQILAAFQQHKASFAFGVWTVRPQ
jgi:hypothetical protein